MMAAGGPMLQFFTKLRRHASLEGASPYLKIKKWKLDSSQRASSLDTRGSPKRRQFQRQRAASESMDQDDNDTHHIDLIQYIARTRDAPYRPGQASTRLLPPLSTPPPSLGSSSHEGPGVIGLSPDPQDEALSLGKRENPDSLDTVGSQDSQTLYRDIWTLRATLEQYAASDQGSNNDRNSVCSDADSVCSLGGRTEGSTDSERGSDGETTNRKLLQMDSGYASIEAPCRETGWLPYGQMLTPREATQPFHAPSLHRRDYSIDEKTDALFHEFLRHDPQFDLQESPLKKHRSRIHLRKQWQRHKQWSDPGVRYFHSSFERQRTPLRRGESVNYPIDTSYHSTLPRIVSAPDEEASNSTGSTPETPKITTTKDKSNDQEYPITSVSPPPIHTDSDHREHEENKHSSVPPEPLDERSSPQPPDATRYGPQTITAELTDKLSASLDDRLYMGLRRIKDSAAERVTVTATHASPDNSPV
uniref:CACN subunit beta associated regulatory protein b n=1 Tax=Neogobius melanostomus TaxID=47308 RepID=A0A8C6T0M8_9GOBI